MEIADPLRDESLPIEVLDINPRHAFSPVTARALPQAKIGPVCGYRPRSRSRSSRSLGDATAPA
jgi:hypothetical protein